MTTGSRDIVITGASVCCNLGDERAKLVDSLRHGRGGRFSPWEPATEFAARCRLIGVYAGDVSDEALGITKKESRFMGRAPRIALKAARAAIAESGIDPRGLGVVVGSGTGDVETHVEVRHKLEASHDCKRVGPTTIPRLMASTVSANLVNVLRTQGPSFSATAACAGGNYNLLLATSLIASGHMEAAIAGGVEATDIHFHAGFDAMGAYNGRDNDTPDRASRPYAQDRAGFIFGEGAGIVVLETEEAARARGATILARVLGYGMSSDGEGQMVAPSATGSRAAMEMAFRHAGVSPAEVDYVNTHGTSTPLGDVEEVRAIRDVMGGRHVAYSSTKGYTGHTISAAGAIEAIFTAWMLDGGWVAPCVHAEPLDAELTDYPPVVAPRDMTLRRALSNSFGFGGTNAVLVLGAAAG